MNKFFTVMLCLFVSVSASAQFTQSNSSNSQTAGNSGGSGVNTVDDKSFHKVVFSWSPMSLSSGGISLDGAFHNIGLLYTNSQLIAKVPLYIEFGGGINVLTWSKKDDNYKYAYNLFALTIPVNLMYRLSLAGGTMHLAPYTGFYGRINIAGSYKESYKGDSESVSVFQEDSGWKRFQLGWQLGLAFDWKMLNVFLGYGLDILPLVKYEERGLTSKSSLSGVNLGIGLKF